ncbi:MAG: site-specific DNA-methyltransferase [Bacteroidetes bacterium]|nr:site-specific DNA-methyltransferase [Bacteroidota bacterium]
MAKQLQKLELTWIGKGNEPQLEPRILIEDPTKSYWLNKEKGAAPPWKKNPESSSNSENPDSDNCNMLIHGDNLLALKALEQNFTGKIKCIYIDPPYNTGNAFEHYDDGIEHSLWLSLMKPRLDILRNLLSDDGSLWVTLDDNEAHYFKVMCDEIFGRSNFVGSTIWQHSLQSKGYPGKFSIHHNYTFCYKKSDRFILNSLDRTEEHNKNYSNPDTTIRNFQ